MAAPKKKSATSAPTIVNPVLRFDGKEHALETALKAGDAPTIKSVGLVKIGPGWVACTITSQGEKVLSIETGEPNMKKIAIDEAKVSFVDNFMNEF